MTQKKLVQFLPQDFYIRGGYAFSSFLNRVKRHIDPTAKTTVQGQLDRAYFFNKSADRLISAYYSPTGKTQYTLPELEAYFTKAKRELDTKLYKGFEMVTVDNFRKGAVVKKGRDWRWGNQDHGGNGVLIEKSTSPGWCKVRWFNDKNRREVAYRINGEYDLVYEDTSIPQEEPEVTITQKKILGYRVPMELFGGAVPAGSLYTRFGFTGGGAKHYTFAKTGMYSLPSEIVEAWEPVHEEEFVEFTIGSWRPVRVFKDKVVTGADIIDMDRLTELVYPSNTENGWKVTVNEATYTIGCTGGITHEQLKAIVDQFNKFKSVQ